MGQNRIPNPNPGNGGIPPFLINDSCLCTGIVSLDVHHTPFQKWPDFVKLVMCNRLGHKLKKD